MVNKRCNKLLIALTVLLTFSSCSGSGEYGNPVVTTNEGKVKGRIWQNGTQAWLGIPYATPPIGDLRWMAPRSPAPWDGVRNAGSFASECVQYGGMLLDLDASTFGQVMGSEDCLYLNVWSPGRSGEQLPVFFWVHGGLNVVGESATSLYHGANLAKAANVVVVTVNYRLGPFGSFAHEALETGDPLDDSGNYNILDLIKALEWVRENIAAFGGDPDNVTIAGESAGGFNVISLLASPLAAGLFSQAMALSPASSLLAVPMEDAHRKADTVLVKLLLGGNLNMAGAGRSEIANYLRSKSAAEILSTSIRLSSLGLNEIGLTTDAFGGSRYEDGTVIPSGYATLYERGEYSKVPFIIGSNTEEGRIFEIALGIISTLDEIELLDFIQSFEPDEPSMTLDELVPPPSQPLYRSIGALLAQAFFMGTGVDPLAEVMSLHQDVYVYLFSWNDQPPPFDFLVGASHMMALPFLFSNFGRDANSLFRFAWSKDNRAQAEKLSESFISYLSGFVRDGVLGVSNTNLPVWEPWGSKSGEGEGKRLRLDTEIKME